MFTITETVPGEGTGMGAAGAAYEPPLLREVGAFGQVTRGGSGKYREAGVGRFLD